jgi:hypothetical protein
VEGDPDARVTLEGLDHGQVGALVRLRDHPAEVADRLVVVERQGQRDPASHAISSCLGSVGVPAIWRSGTL